ncbi:MAG: hypothetical protein UT42_C0019G0004 [Candidatus Falkowbacteria bacterium GW2011_GWA2_39_24]|uniref:Uncharacterized protein n=1 Tax=Candidatus Falkowbacteria bacterium GW2011_GWA2_39_24 TaxID=1618634 RepID=A0A0G0NGZ0_9BACT|nr:MAG: hypothetical protein UT42_C0019G0004 [Candidatus Falkowbacteria bacterium GW2011_GWA2_39_24]
METLFSFFSDYGLLISLLIVAVGTYFMFKRWQKKQQAKKTRKVAIAIRASFWTTQFAQLKVFLLFMVNRKPQTKNTTTISRSKKQNTTTTSQPKKQEWWIGKEKIIRLSIWALLLFIISMIAAFWTPEGSLTNIQAWDNRVMGGTNHGSHEWGIINIIIFVLSTLGYGIILAYLYGSGVIVKDKQEAQAKARQEKIAQTAKQQRNNQSINTTLGVQS